MTLRGIPFTFSENLIAHILRLPRIPDSSYPYITIDKALIASTLCGKPYNWDGKKLTQGELSPSYRLLNLIITSNIYPRSNHQMISFDKAHFLYCVGNGIPIDIPKLIFQQIYHAARSQILRHLPYGSLITKIAMRLRIPIYPNEERKFSSKPINHFTCSQSIARVEARRRRDNEPVVPQIEYGEPSSSRDQFTILSEKIDHL